MPETELNIHPLATTVAEGIAIGIVTLVQSQGGNADLANIVHKIAERIERGLCLTQLTWDKAILDWLDQHPKPIVVQGGVDDGSEAIFWGVAAKTGNLRQAVIAAYQAEEAAKLAALQAQAPASPQQTPPKEGETAA